MTAIVAGTPVERSFIQSRLCEPHLASIIEQFIPVEDLGNLLLEAFKGSKRSLDSLIDVTCIFDRVIKNPNFQGIPTDLLGEIFITACNRGLTPIVENLMGNSCISEISLDKFTGAFASAATQGHSHVFRAFILNPRFITIPVESLESALISTACYGRIPLVKDLIHSSRYKEIPPIQITQALIWAANKGHAAVVEALLSANSFSKEDLEWTVGVANQNGHPAIAEMLQKMIKET